MPPPWKNKLLKNLDPAVRSWNGYPTYGLGHGPSGNSTVLPIYFNNQLGNDLGFDPGYVYNFDARMVSQNISIPIGNNGVDHFETQKYLIRPPRIIRVIWDMGWWYFEHFPMQLSVSTYDSYDESIYFTPPNAGPGGIENTINYYNDFTSAINAFGVANKINVGHMSFQNTGDWTGPTQSPITFVSSGSRPDTAYRPVNVPSRWMFNLIPRYRWTGNNFFFFTTPLGNPNWIEPDHEQYIIGGKCLNIIFCTDGYSAYHGCSSRLFNNTLTDLSTVGNAAMMTEDIDTIKRRSQYFEKWGTILVASPKNPEFFPLWLQDASTSTNTFTPQAYAYYDAQLHFNSVVSLLSGYNFTLLMRPTHMVTPPTSRHATYESQSMGFTRGQITVAEIMAAVETFWSGE